MTITNLASRKVPWARTLSQSVRCRGVSLPSGQYRGSATVLQDFNGNDISNISFLCARHLHYGYHLTTIKGGNKEFMKLERYRSFLVAYRATYIMTEVMMLSVWHILLKDIRKRAEKLRKALVRLGPFYIKLGQALSTRPDILPSAYCQELAKLQDHVPPFRSSVALKFIESELGSSVEELFADISKQPVAAASLGQVYRARLISGELVAVKVQRPGLKARLTIDSYLVRMVGVSLKRFLGARGDIVAAVNEMVENMFDEIDYIKEGQNAERFAILYGGFSGGSVNKGIDTRSRDGEIAGLVKVPKIYWKFSSRGVLTMEWIDGIKMTDLEKLRKMKFDIQQLIDQGVFSSLRQLLEEGFFHADPHPGNLVVTKEGVLAYFDFGMMGDFPREYRIGLIRTLIHFVNRDSMGLANDFADLGFVPEGADMNAIADALQSSFGDENTKAQLDFQGIMNQLSNVMYNFDFRLPPQYALVIRALGSLEGTATLLDPDFKVVASAYPFIIGRLLADPDPSMRKILRELLIRNNGSIRWGRLERLVIAIAEQSSRQSPSKEGTKSVNWSGQDGLGKGTTRIWGMFDTRTVVSATSDLIEFLLSENGYRVRILLVKDIVTSFESVIDEATSNGRCDQKPGETVGRSQSSQAWEHMKGRKQVNFPSRISMAISAFIKAVDSAPELWISMLIRFAARAEAQALAAEILWSLACIGYTKSTESFWLFLSKLLHKIYDT